MPDSAEGWGYLPGARAAEHTGVDQHSDGVGAHSDLPGKTPAWQIPEQGRAEQGRAFWHSPADSGRNKNHDQRRTSSPGGADRLVFTLAPVAVMVPALLMFTVIPFGGETFLTNLNVGILFIVAVTAVETIGVFMAGWASNNKYAPVWGDEGRGTAGQLRNPSGYLHHGGRADRGVYGVDRHCWSPEQLAPDTVPATGIP